MHESVGGVVYKIFHAEPIAVTKKIEWSAPGGWSPEHIDCYAAQGNATRIFVKGRYESQLDDWKKVEAIRLSAFSYAVSGGYSASRLGATEMRTLLKGLEKTLDLFPALFATNCS